MLSASHTQKPRHENLSQNDLLQQEWQFPNQHFITVEASNPVSAHQHLVFVLDPRQEPAAQNQIRQHHYFPQETGVN